MRTFKQAALVALAAAAGFAAVLWLAPEQHAPETVPVRAARGMATVEDVPLPPEGSGVGRPAPAGSGPVAARPANPMASPVTDPVGLDPLYYPVPAPSALPPSRFGDAPAPEVAAVAAIVVDEASGAVLFAKNAYAPLAPASLTKIATAILVLEAGDLDRPVDIDVDSRKMPRSSVMGLIPGDRFTVRDLLYGLMLPSGNDAALALARATSGSDAAFVEQMNALAERLNLHSTSFANPHGLGASNHATSAHDLAMLSRYAMTVPGFRDLVTTYSYRASGSRDIAMYNINTFLGKYSGADGIKTGYTRRAGQTLVASAVRAGRRLYAVVLNDTNRDADAAALLDWAFAAHDWPGD